MRRSTITFRVVVIINLLSVILAFMATYIAAFTVSPKFVSVYLTPLMFLLYTPIAIITIKTLYKVKDKKPTLPSMIIIMLLIFFIILRCLQRLMFYRLGYYMIEKIPGFVLLMFLSLYFKLNPKLNGLCRGLLAPYNKILCLTCYVLPTIPLLLIVATRANAIQYGLNPTLSSIGYYTVNSFFEELMFRGLLFTWLSLSHLGVIWGGVIVQGILFGIWHIPHHIIASEITAATLHVIYACGVGVLYGFIRAFTSSLIIPIILHTIWNTLATLTAYAITWTKEYVMIMAISYLSSIILSGVIFLKSYRPTTS